MQILNETKTYSLYTRYVDYFIFVELKEDLIIMSDKCSDLRISIDYNLSTLVTSSTKINITSPSRDVCILGENKNIYLFDTITKKFYPIYLLYLCSDKKYNENKLKIQLAKYLLAN